MGERQPVPVYRREALGRGQQFAGPALIVEPVATTCVKAGWRVEVTTAGHLYLSVQADCHQ
jgi:N-methylhydantoinase A/oxoprolinase/acetone carboxylase beta subunit